MSNTPAAATMHTRASSITRALDQIGDKWCLLILQEVFLGINTFNDMLAATGVSRGVLSDRLKWLESVDCLRKRRKSESSRRYSYHLTAKSFDLYANALMALAWEKRFYDFPHLQYPQLIHELCGEPFWPGMRCAACRGEVHCADVEYRPGPGASKDQRQKKVRRRSSISVMNAVKSQTLYKNLVHIVGDRWTANVIALAFHGFERFDEFNRELPIATNILADRLKFLVDQGIFEPVAYQTKPPRFRYKLTARGEGLFPWFLTLLQWGDKWCDENGLGPPMALVHKTCGQPLRGEVICSQCQGELHAKEVRFSRLELDYPVTSESDEFCPSS